MVRIFLLFIMIAGVPPQAASALSFDCDVPADRYSTVSEEVKGPSYSVGAMIELIAGRTGKYVPVVGFRLVSSDESNRIALRLVAPDANSKMFNVVLTTRVSDGKETENILGQIVLDHPTRLQLELSESGRLSLWVGEKSFGTDFQPMVSGRAIAICSTGQFKFSVMRFDASNGK